MIPEDRIIVFSPHYDDFVFFLGGYIMELEDNELFFKKTYENINVFTRSNYQAGEEEGNKDTSLERIKYAVGQRIIEDLDCLDELLGKRNFKYRLLGEKESQLRGKIFADSDMEFPHGMYDDFSEEDEEIFNRVKERVKELINQDNTALIFPVGFKEHIDHFIVREAGITTAREYKDEMNATFYFAEDKPYAGISNEEELKRIKNFIEENELETIAFRHHPQELIDLIFKHYISQVEKVYKEGIEQRNEYLMNYYSVDYPIDRIYKFNS